MIKFDFNSMVDSFIDKDNYDMLMDRKIEVYNKFSKEYMTGWTKKIDKEEVRKIKDVAKEVKSHSKCLVVIGIGGSFLGSYAVKEMLGNYFKKDKFEVIYAGTTLSSKYMNELLEYLEDIDFSINGKVYENKLVGVASKNKTAKVMAKTREESKKKRAYR